MDIQTTILNGVASILGIFVSIFFAAMVAYVKQHFSAKQISTAMGIATEAVTYVGQVTNKLQIPDSVKYDSALTRAKDLASKIGLNFTDAQWKTLLESAHKKAKGGLQPFQEIANTTTPYTVEDIADMINKKLEEAMPKMYTGSQEEVLKTASVTLAPIITVEAGADPKPIAEIIQKTIDQVGEQAKTQAVSDLTQKLSAVVQEAVGFVDPALDPEVVPLS